MALVAAFVFGCTAPTTPPLLPPPTSDEILAIVSTFDGLDPMSFSAAEDIVVMGYQYVPVLIELLQDDDLRVRWAAIYGLSRLAKEDDVEGVSTGLNDPNLAIRVIAAATLLKLGDNRGKDILEDATTSNEILLYSHPPELIRDYATGVLDAYNGTSLLGPPSHSFSSTALPLTYIARQTTVTREERSITVTVNIEFYGPGATQELIGGWELDIEDFWNGPDGHQMFGYCTVTFDVVTRIRDEGDAPTEGSHQIEVLDLNPGEFHTSKAGVSQQSTGGEWDDQDTRNHVAHETGHLMGLYDEYHYEDVDGDGDDDYVNDNPQPEDPQSIMAQTWGNVAPLQEHIDEIINLAGVNFPAGIPIVAEFEILYSAGDSVSAGDLLEENYALGRDQNWEKYLDDPGTYDQLQCSVGQVGSVQCWYDEDHDRYTWTFVNIGSHLFGRYTLDSIEGYTQAKIKASIAAGSPFIDFYEWYPFFLEIYINGIKAGETLITLSDVYECVIPLDFSAVATGTDVMVKFTSNRLKVVNPIPETPFFSSGEIRFFGDNAIILNTFLILE